MAGDVVIQADGLSKRYRIGELREPYGSLRESLMRTIRSPLAGLRNRGETFWALKDVSFEIERGEVVGIIGRNGAGKSTLLKILARITKPTQGRAVIRGRVGSLLEVGTGFHQELTGRENVYLNGAILGMRRHEIDRKFDEIVDFAEIEKFLDTPVKRYSSGMYVRLAFAVAAHLEPEIMLVDEVLAVGDAAFQKKCLGKMGTVAGAGRTIILVSHNMASIHALCTTAVWINNGVIVEEGITKSVVGRYLSSMTEVSGTEIYERTERVGDGRIKFTEFDYYGKERGSPLVCGSPAHFEISYKVVPGVVPQNVRVSIGVNTSLGENLLLLSNHLVDAEYSSIPDFGKFLCRIDKLPLVSGTYTINLYCTLRGVVTDWLTDAVTISIEQGDFFGTGQTSPETHSKFLIPQVWGITS